MAKTVLYIAVSLDGYIAGRDDDLSWLDPYSDVDYEFDKFLSTIGAIIVGRRTYDIEVARGWESGHPVPTFVVTRRLRDGKPRRPDVFFIDDDIAEVLKKAKQVTQKDIWLEGGADLARQFLDRDLIDEFVISVVPVVLGEGVRLFERTGRRMPLALSGVKQFDKGLVQLIYGRASSAS
jgi:dihydrofolate reductase